MSSVDQLPVKVWPVRYGPVLVRARLPLTAYRPWKEKTRYVVFPEAEIRLRDPLSDEG
jgi:hypothetical protein